MTIDADVEMVIQDWFQEWCILSNMQMDQGGNQGDEQGNGQEDDQENDGGNGKGNYMQKEYDDNDDSEHNTD